MEPQAVTYVITLDIKPGRADDFLALLTPVLDRMRREAGFVNAVLHRDPDRPERFMLYETWRDHDEVMRVEIHRPYRQAYWRELPGLLAREREIRIWRPLRGDGAIEPTPAAPQATAGSRIRQAAISQSISARAP